MDTKLQTAGTCQDPEKRVLKNKTPEKRHVSRSMGGGGRDRVLLFLENKRLFELVESYLQKMSEAEQLITRRFLTCSLIYRNAQRQGPVTNLKVVEQSLAEGQDTANGTVYVYKVWEHKTCGQFGSANIVVPQDMHTLVCKYINNHRPTPAQGEEDYIYQ